MLSERKPFAIVGRKAASAVLKGRLFEALSPLWVNVKQPPFQAEALRLD